MLGLLQTGGEACPNSSAHAELPLIPLGDLISVRTGLRTRVRSQLLGGGLTPGTSCVPRCPSIAGTALLCEPRDRGGAGGQVSAEGRTHLQVTNNSVELLLIHFYTNYTLILL